MMVRATATALLVATATSSSDVRGATDWTVGASILICGFGVVCEYQKPARPRGG
jgi:hypothetical protein